MKIVNQRLTGLGLLKHPAKTFIGKIEKGFDFLGYRFSPEGLTVARKTVEQFVTRAHRLYEQERGRRHAAARPCVARPTMEHVGARRSGFGSTANSATFGVTTLRCNEIC
ncbi:MAG: hypothetical protein ABI618_13955 [Nitrospirota bacterium]